MLQKSSLRSKKDKLRSSVEHRIHDLDRERRTASSEPIQTITRANVRTALHRNRSYGDVALELIEPDEDQPRRVDTTSEAFGDLVASVRERGVLQPISVRWIESRNRFEIVAGERRYRAAKAAKLATIPVVLRDLDDRQKALDQLVENIQREDMHPLQEARAFQAYLEVTGETQTRLAKRIGKSQPYIAQTLSLLEKLSSAEQDELSRYSPANMPSKSLILEAFRTSDAETRGRILRGELTREQARSSVHKAERTKQGRPRNFSQRIELPETNAVVTVSFRRQRAGSSEVLHALEEARIKVRRRSSGS